MKTLIPNNSKWVQSNQGDLFGNLWATWNIDLTSNRGKLRPSPRTVINTDDDESGDFPQYPVSAFVRGDFDGTERWWALWGNTMAKLSDADPTDSGFTEDGLSHSSSSDYDESDMVSWNGNLIVSLTTDIAKLTGGVWTNDWWTNAGELNQSVLNNNIPHPLHESKSSRRLLIGDDNQVHAVDTSGNVVTGAVTLPDKYRVIWIRSSSDRNWIGTWNTQGGKAMIFEYTELQKNYDNGYEVGSDIAMAGEVKNGIPYATLRSGELVAFSGGGFEPVAKLPIAGSDHEWASSSENSVYGYRLVHPNGMTTIDGNIHILLSNHIDGTQQTDTDLYERFPAGVWEFDEDVGLYHRYGLSSYEGTVKDYGKPFIYDEVGALAENDVTKGRFLASAELRTGVSVGGNAVLTGILHLNEDNDVAKRGYFITPEIHSSEVADNWDGVWMLFKQLENSGDEFIVKYRTSKSTSLPVAIITGTWSDTDTFTTTDTSAASVSAGDEIFVMTGLGSGTTAHVSSITESGGTYTVNLDETIPNASSGTMRAYAQNWNKLTPFSTQGVLRHFIPLGQNEKEWIQLKVELRGTGANPEIDKAEIIHNTSVFSEQ